ncbi:uncharacterized protein LOC130520300 [Takifugu flavidus]|uniref:uncharacterized protein LOC130520300 n=1 Tax=Takifugu flavidus TaxID=433684 RepID=UPI002544AFE2|nr:uncharacterized protein LOC130520300 [Takifugu flavidus]
MGCCCSKTEEWRDSDSNSDSDSDSISGIDSDISSLSDILHYSGWSTKTVEHRQHTTAGTQHAWLDAELKGDSRCKEEPEVLRNPTRGVGPTLDSDPCVALPRLSTGGEENTPVVSKPSKPVQSTLVGPLSVAFMVTQASGDHQRPKVDPKPQRDEKGGEELHVLTTAPPQAFKTTTCSIGCMCDIDADDLEQEQSQCATAGATDESINRAANQVINTSSWTRPWFIINISSWTRPWFIPNTSSWTRPWFIINTSSWTRPWFIPNTSSWTRPWFIPNTSSWTRPWFIPNTSSWTRLWFIPHTSSWTRRSTKRLPASPRPTTVTVHC